MNERDALEVARAVVGVVVLLVGIPIWRAVRGDLVTARNQQPVTRWMAHERVRRMTRMAAATRRVGVYVLLALCLTIVALMAVANHPWLAVASNLNQILQGAMLWRLCDLEVHTREALVNLAESEHVVDDEVHA